MANLDGKELVNQFKAANWKGPGELSEFLEVAGTPMLHDLLKVVEILGNKRFSTDGIRHRMRCTAFGKIAADFEDIELFVPYVKVLKSADRLLRTTITPLIIKTNNIKEHNLLCDLLKSNDDELRDFSCQVLLEIAGKSAMDRLAGLVRQRDFRGRRQGIEVLVKKSGHHAIEALVEALPVATPPEQMFILKQLGNKHFVARDLSGALEAIAVALELPEKGVVAAAILAFCTLCEEDDYFDYIAPFLNKTDVRLVRAAVEGLVNFRSPRIVDVLERKIKEGPNAIRHTVLNTVELIGDDSILPPLVQGLAHRQVSIRSRAGEILAELSKGDKLDVARTIIWLLRSPDTNVRRMAAEIITTTPDPTGKLWPKLLRFLRDEDWWVRERVKDALVVMAGAKLARHVVHYFEDPSDVVRRFAVDILYRLKDPATLGLLVRIASEDKDWWVQEKAVEAIAGIKDSSATPYVLDVMSRFEHLHVACLNALKEINARETAPHAAALLASPDLDVRMAALDCLRVFEARKMSDQVAVLMADPDPGIQKLARELLTRWNLKDLGDSVAKNADTTSFLDQLLIAVARRDGDYLIIAANKKPSIKKRGKLSALVKQLLSPEQVTALLTPHLSMSQMQDLRELKDVDFSYAVKVEGLRFRVNIFNQRGGLAGVFRIIKGDIPDMKALGLPESLLEFGDHKNGLVLIGGPSGSGKTTTLTAIMDYINSNHRKHIVSLEDPIEVVHPNKMGLVNQRELGTHTSSLENALRSTLRQDPDVIMVGELRDFETIQFAVTAAETGHLVFGTVHTVSAHTTVDRVINVFPPGLQAQVRTMLSESLRAVVCQFLLQRKDMPGQIPALEVMLNNGAISALIRKGKTFQIPQAITTNRESGMQLMDHDLSRLYHEGLVYAEEVYMKAHNKAEFEEIIDPEGAAERKAQKNKGKDATKPLNAETSAEQRSH